MKFWEALREMQENGRKCVIAGKTDGGYYSYLRDDNGYAIYYRSQECRGASASSKILIDSFHLCSDWQLVEEPRKVKLFRYYYNAGEEDIIGSSHWTTESFKDYTKNYYRPVLLKTEEKEIEIL